MELLERAGPAFTTAGEPVEAADALSLAGSHHQELGEWEPALRAYQRAAAAYRELGEGPGEAARSARWAPWRPGQATPSGPSSSTYGPPP